MLHSILVISTSGIVLFQKEFIHGGKSKQMGGILTAMLNFSVTKTGLPVSYIHMQNVGVSIASSAESRVTCAVFHDPADGAEFGKLLARELLFSFIASYLSELSSSVGGLSSSSSSSLNPSLRNNDPYSASGLHAAAAAGNTAGIYAMDHFSSFQGKIPHIIQNAVKPLLENLQSQRGISLVLLSSASLHDGVDSSLSSLSSSSSLLHTGNTEVDKLAVLANQQAILNCATDIMGVQHDTPHSIVLRSRRSTLLMLRVERANLIVVFKNSVDASVTMQQIEKTAELVRKVLVMASNLKT